MESSAKDNVANILDSGYITQGIQVDEFEKKLKDYFSWPWLLTLNSATSGLTLAYRLLNITAEDTVISAPLTCFATTCGILASTDKIVWADTDTSTCNIDLDDVENKLTEDTKALSLVAWGGNPVDLDRVYSIQDAAKERYNVDLGVVQDCAHGFSSSWDGKKLGTDARTIAVYSMQAIKHLTTGDGGIILLPNEEMYERAKRLRWFGIDRDQRSKPGADFRLEPDIPEAGFKMHLTDINAAIGLANLSGLDYAISRHKANADFYNERLQGIQTYELLKRDDKAVSSYWIYTLKIRDGLKQEFKYFMTANNIVVSQVHARNDKNSCVEHLQTDLPQLDILEREIICIPVGWWVTDENREYIVEKMMEFDRIYFPNIVQLQEHERDQYMELLLHFNGHSGNQRDFPVDGIYVLKIGSKMISSAKLVIEEKAYEPLGHLEDIVTDPSYRGRGYGKKLVKYMCRLGIERGCYKVILSAKNSLKPFYEECGMTEVGTAFEMRK
jgi:dTDP-4-amino-4,6-dideoxygalactose transaminase